MADQRPRSTAKRTSALTVGLLAFSMGVAPIDAGAAPRDEPIRPDYSRAERTRPPLPDEESERELPAELRITRPRPEESDERPDRDRSTAHRASVPRASEIREQGRIAGRLTADRVVEAVGRREYFRIGFYEGLNDGIDDPRLGEWDYAEGERQGLRDHEARLVGREFGERAAAEAADVSAQEQVAEQFSRLGERPGFVPSPGVPGELPAPALVPEPTVEEIFDEFPVGRSGHLEEGFAHWILDWEFGPARLHRARSYGDFYEAGWRSPDAAFEAWAGTRARSARQYHELKTAQERAVFEAAFRGAFVDRLAELYPKRLLGAYRRGLHEGWSYGVFVRREWDYRRGFHSGYRRALERSARETYFRAYDDDYEAAYRRWFDDWSHNPKPEIGDVSLVDGNRDGVFEPGEDLLVDYELINYGGGDGHLPLELTGPALVRPAGVLVDLPARSSTRGAEALRAQIRPGIEPRTSTRVSLALAGRDRDVPLRVSYPLQLRLPEWRVERRTLDGEVHVEVALENQSRLPVDGSLELLAPALPGFRLVEELGVLEPGVVRAVPLDVRGFDPLDLLAGPVSFEVELLAGDRVHDHQRYELAGAAADLGSRDLLAYMLDLARRGSSTRRQVDATRELLMQRLHEDWRAAVAASGNPYKQDYKSRGSETALGDLVRTSRLEGPVVRRHPVFAGLSSDVRELAAELPGAHPLLRKYVRKLAKQLP